MPYGVIAECAEKIRPSKIRPVRFTEPELRMRRLPQQESRQSLLSRGSDDQIGIGLSRGVKMFRDVIHVEDLGKFLDRGSRLGMLLQQFTSRVGDLLASAVPNGDVDLHPGAPLRARGGRRQSGRGLGGQ